MRRFIEFAGGRKFAMLAGLLAVSCATSEVSQAEMADRPSDYEVEVQANDEARAFEIVLRSHSNESLCFHSQDWPLDNGLWVGEADLFQIKTPTGLIEPPDENPGICVGSSCVEKIQPKGSIAGKLSYSVFGNADEIASLESKELIYNIALWFCDD